MIFFTCLVLGRDRSAMNPSVTPMRNELEDWLPMQNIASLRNQWMPRKPGSPTPYEDNVYGEEKAKHRKEPGEVTIDDGARRRTYKIYARSKL